MSPQGEREQTRERRSLLKNKAISVITAGINGKDNDMSTEASKKGNRKSSKRSINAQSVARDVTERVRKGQKVVIGEILRKRGYSESVSKSPTKVTKTESFQEAISPVVQAMVSERDRIIKAMAEQKLSKVKYRDLTDAVDKLTKNIQLLTGGATDRVMIGDILDEIEQGNN